MFQITPDPSWHYAQLWEDMRKIYLNSAEIEIKLSRPGAENQNDEIDNFAKENLMKIREIANNWIHDVPQDIELNLIDNLPPDDFIC